MSLLEIGDFVFDFENGVEDGRSDKVNFVGDFGELLQCVKHGSRNWGEIIGFAADDVVFADLDSGGRLAGGFALFLGVFYYLAVGLRNAKFVDEELDALGDFGGDEAFFEVGHGAVITADDLIFGGFPDGFVVGDTLADYINTHVGGRVVDGFAGDATENFLQNWEGFEVAVIVDDGFTVFC